MAMVKLELKLNNETKPTKMNLENDDRFTAEHKNKALQKHPNPGDLIKVYKGNDGRAGVFYANHKRVDTVNGREVCVCTLSLDNEPEFKSIKFFLPEFRIVIVNK